MHCFTATILFILCAIFLTSAAATDKRQIFEEVLTCNDETGSCESPSAAAIQKIISYDIDNGSLTIDSQLTYTEPFNQYGMDEARTLRELVKNVHSLELLIAEGEDNLDYHELYMMIIAVTNDLSVLAEVHKEKWLYGSLDGTSALDSNHFDETLVICKATMRLLNVLKLNATNFDKESTEYISTAMASATLMLGDLFQLRPSIDPSAIIEDDYSTAYKHFIFAESMMLQSLLSMGIDKNGDLIEDNDEMYDRKEDEMYYSQVLDAAKTVYASITSRLGSLFVDLCLNNLRFDTSGFAADENQFDVPSLELTENQKRVLRNAYDKLETSVALHRKIRHSSGDVQISMADAYSRMAAANSLLQEWSLAATNSESGLSILPVINHQSKDLEMNASEADVIAIVITITQSLFEAYLHLPGEIEAAKDAFRKHLLARQAAEIGYFNDIFDKELTNENEENVREALLLRKDSTPPLVDSVQIQELLSQYQSMLGEVSGIQYSELNIDGETANVASDSFYEGSLHSVIGSLYLDLNEPWEAKDELETAVQLLGEGIELVDSGTYEVIGDDGKPLTYSLRLELASVLHSLSYTYLALMQWESSYDTFEEAMDIYQSELLEGENPMEWNAIATTTSSSQEGSSITDRLLNYFFKESGDKVDLEDFQPVVNRTMS